MMTPRVVVATLSVFTAAGLGASVSVVSEARPPTLEVPWTRTAVMGGTSAAGARHVQLRFAAELKGTPDLRDDVEVGWQEVGGVEPQPFRILIPAGCFVASRRGVQVDDFRTCGVEMSVESSMRGRVLLGIVDFDARVVSRDAGAFRFDILTTLIPPDPVVPPDPIVPPDPVHAFIGALGGAAVRIAIGTVASMASPPLRTETVSGIEPTPF